MSKEKQKEVIERLTIALTNSLEHASDDPEQALLHQAKLLDISFRKFLAEDAVSMFAVSSYFETAQKVQNQYRYTFKELQAAKKWQNANQSAKT